jgi:small-conductance mechanosensitive channel
MKVTDQVINAVQENWSRFVEHIPAIALALAIAVIGLFVISRVTRMGKRYISSRSQDPLMTNFLSKSISLILGTIVLLFALRILGLTGIATAIFTAAGAGAVILGFAFRDIGENFISGIILSFNRPFNVDDTVQIGDIFGKVRTMEFRYTKLKTFDGRDVYIPNSDVIKKAVFNYTEDGFYRLEFTVGLAYEDTLDDARDLIVATVQKCEGVLSDEDHEVVAVVDELATSTVNFVVRFWVETLDYRKRSMQIRGNVITRVKEALEDNGFSLPADIQEIKFYGGQDSIPVSIREESK